MKRFVLITLLIGILALGISCAAPAAAPTAAPPVLLPSALEAEGGTTNSDVPGTNQRKSVPAQPTGAPMGNEADQAQDRMIVYTGSVTLQVNDTAQAITQIQDILKNVNGYIASKNVVARGDNKLRGTINVRIPAVALDSTLTQIKALGVKVLKETADSNDVTAEYVDLEARRKNLEAYEIELQKLLETVRERTGKAEDILAVYNQLTQVRGEIEQIKGRQNYLQNTSALATYAIELVPVEEIVVEGKPGWNPGEIFAASLNDLVTALQGLVGVTIRFMVVVVPLLLILLVPVVLFFLIVRALVKRRNNKKVVPSS